MTTKFNGTIKDDAMAGKLLQFLVDNGVQIQQTAFGGQPEYSLNFDSNCINKLADTSKPANSKVASISRAKK